MHGYRQVHVCQCQCANVISKGVFFLLFSLHRVIKFCFWLLLFFTCYIKIIKFLLSVDVRKGVGETLTRQRGRDKLGKEGREYILCICARWGTPHARVHVCWGTWVYASFPSINLYSINIFFLPQLIAWPMMDRDMWSAVLFIILFPLSKQLWHHGVTYLPSSILPQPVEFNWLRVIELVYLTLSGDDPQVIYFCYSFSSVVYSPFSPSSPWSVLSYLHLCPTLVSILSLFWATYLVKSLFVLVDWQ